MIHRMPEIRVRNGGCGACTLPLPKVCIIENGNGCGSQQPLINRNHRGECFEFDRGLETMEEAMNNIHGILRQEEFRRKKEKGRTTIINTFKY